MPNPDSDKLYSGIGPFLKTGIGQYPTTAIQTLVSSPVMQKELERQNKQRYANDVKSYQNQTKSLTTKEIEDIVWAIYDAKNTYQDIKTLVPRLNDATMCSYLTNPPELDSSKETLSLQLSPLLISSNQHVAYFSYIDPREDYTLPYRFKPTDSFKLSVSGENMLYALKKEKYMLELAERSLEISEKSLMLSKCSTRYSRYAAYLSAISIVIAILIAVLQATGFPVLLKLWQSLLP